MSIFEQEKPSTIIDAVENVADALRSASAAVLCPGLFGKDASGGHVGCLTEAVVGVTAGLFEIASAISDLAEAVRSSREE